MNITNFIKRLNRLPTLYEDSYKAFHIAKGSISLYIFGILLIIVSFFELGENLLKINWKIILPLTLVFLTSLSLTIFIYKKHNFQSKFFKIFDIINKIIFITSIIIINYFANDPRTAWWIAYFLAIVLISQLGEFYWIFFLVLIIYPSIIGFLFVTNNYANTKIGFSNYNKLFPFFISFFSGLLYFYQSKLRKSEMTVRENNLKLINELNELKIALDRKRISRDLHDTLGSLLTGNIIQTEVAREELYKNPDRTYELLKVIESISRDALIKMREAIYSIVEDKELINEFPQYVITKCNDILKLKNISTNIECPKEINEKISPKMKFTLFKVINEIITNILKHSNATNVNIAFKIINNNLELTIQENGQGIIIDKKATGDGINNINHRVAEIGGTIKINSSVKNNFQIDITLPI